MQTTNGTEAGAAVRERFVVTLPAGLIERIKRLSQVEKRSTSHQTELLLERALEPERETVAA